MLEFSEIKRTFCFMNFRLLRILLACCAVLFAQSVESGNSFNRYMSADGGVDPLSGTARFEVPLATLTAGDVFASFSLNYSGNVSQTVKNRNDLSPSGWTGLGWSLGFAKIVSDNNRSMSLLDDFYFLITAEGLRYRLV